MERSNPLPASARVWATPTVHIEPSSGQEAAARSTCPIGFDTCDEGGGINSCVYGLDCP